MTISLIVTLAGILTVLVLVVRFARPIARFLFALADARDAFLVTWRAGGGRHTSKPVHNVQPIKVYMGTASDVVTALEQLGMKHNDAVKLVVDMHQEGDKFEDLFQRCMKRNRKSA